jgi:hypothetical protein
MPDTVSDHLLQRLEAWNVRRIFTYPGDGINGIMGARRRATEFAKLLGLDGIRVERPEGRGRCMGTSARERCPIRHRCARRPKRADTAT